MPAIKITDRPALKKIKSAGWACKNVQFGQVIGSVRKMNQIKQDTSPTLHTVVL